MKAFTSKHRRRIRSGKGGQAPQNAQSETIFEFLLFMNNNLTLAGPPPW